jgi:hypothetical protein
MGHGDPADPAAIRRIGQHALHVRVHERPRIDDEARIAAHEPGVRPLQRERPGVVGGDLLDVVHQGQRAFCIRAGSARRATKSTLGAPVTRGIMPAGRRSTA